MGSHAGAPLPDAAGVFRRRGYGREELVQRLLTVLVIGHEPVGWNYSAAPTERGRCYIEGIDALAFGTAWRGVPVFIDEYELLKRSNQERDAWPDHAALWPDRTLLIELKTDPGSHKAGQCERYIDLGIHHNPDRRVDLIYLTGPMKPWQPLACPDTSSWAHLTWEQVLPLIESCWANDQEAGELVSLLRDVIGTLALPWRRALPDLAERWDATASRVLRNQVADVSSIQVPVLHGVEEAASLVAADHRQRGVHIATDDPEELDAMRQAVAERLAAAGVDGHVRPWIWKRSSGGQPLTALGAEVGYEVRLSWFN